MLHQYSFKNFQSFKDTHVVSLKLNNQVPSRGWEANSQSGQRLSTALAVMGANGSGKTALLKPLVFVIDFIKHSFHAQPESDIPVIPYIGYEDEATEIELEMEDNKGTLWKYILKLTPKRVIYEALYRKKIRYNYVFIREWNGKSYTIRQQNFDLNREESLKARPNASLISTAAQYGVEIFGQDTFADFVTNINISGRADSFPLSEIIGAAGIYFNDTEAMDLMTQLLTQWDLGLSDISLQEKEIALKDGESKKVYLPFGVHTNKDGEVFRLPLYRESSGTQSLFILLSKLLPILKNGGLAVIDEIENDLHPHMVEPILDLFSNTNTNPNNAQIIFTCHSPEVLDFLQKGQVIFVEKNDCESEAFRGDEINGLRSDDNFRAKYMSGALGAVPWL